MKELLKVDLRISRQQSGLSGRDVAALLSINTARLSKLENGYARPKVREIISLSLIYGKSIDELFLLSSSRLTEKLKANLATLDFTNEEGAKGGRQRLDSLNALSERLHILDQAENEA